MNQGHNEFVEWSDNQAESQFSIVKDERKSSTE